MTFKNLILGDFSRGFGLTPRFLRLPLDTWESNGLGQWIPTTDVTETEKEIKVTAELPGLDEKDINVELSDNVLTISGERKTEKEEKEKNYYRSERSYGSFQRSFALPREVDQEKVAATFKKGVLTLTLPKAAAAQNKTKKIQVKSE